MFVQYESDGITYMRKATPEEAEARLCGMDDGEEDKASRENEYQGDTRHMYRAGYRHGRSLAFLPPRRT